MTTQTETVADAAFYNGSRLKLRGSHLIAAVGDIDTPSLKTVCLVAEREGDLQVAIGLGKRLAKAGHAISVYFQEIDEDKKARKR